MAALSFFFRAIQRKFLHVVFIQEPRWTSKQPNLPPLPAQETVTEENYLGIEIFRFYIRCPKCHQEITFKTDPENADYVAENGISRMPSGSDRYSCTYSICRVYVCRCYAVAHGASEPRVMVIDEWRERKQSGNEGE